MTDTTEPILVDAIQTTSGGCRLSFVGLERVGQSLHNLEATAYFRDDAGHEVSSVAGPIQVRLPSVSEGCGALEEEHSTIRTLLLFKRLPDCKTRLRSLFPSFQGSVKWFNALTIPVRFQAFSIRDA